MEGMREVEIDAIPLARLAALLAPERVEKLNRYTVLAQQLLRGRVVWSVNATARGGGVAEMLQALLAYARGAEVDARWLVLSADNEFFAITQRVHNLLHGAPGDGGPLGEAERAHYREVAERNVEMMRSVVKAGDIVLLHDPQPAGMVEGLRDAGAHVVWRSHVGRDTPNEYTEQAWDFLREFIEPADAFIFSRAEYAPSWIPTEMVRLIPPSLDPFSAKNATLDPADVATTLRVAGLVDTPPTGGSLQFTRRDGTQGEVRRHAGLLREGGVVPGSAQVVLQVSRWDRLKDMQGVLTGFARQLDQMPETAHLMLVGPDVSGVADDPEGAEVFEECMAAWRALPAPARNRVHLCSLPMDDVDENAHLVNALQRHAAVVVQKSLVEGFGLTVTEPMWKARPVIASAVGGIRDQIEDGVSGILLTDPNDLDTFGKHVREVLYDEELGRRLGTAAQARVQDRFLGDRHLIQYVELFQTLLERG
jgi:trehalose synthase